MGGAERLERQRTGGRLDARARIEELLDPGTFVALGALVGSLQRGATPPAPADGLVAGHGTIEGRPVLVGAEDFTVMGGSIGLGNASKRHRLAQLAEQERAPLVMLLDGAGERAQNAFERRGRGPNDLQALAALSGLVPTVAVVMGPSAGHGALTAPLMDFVVMVEGAAVFSAGPPLVKAATGEDVTKEELGGTAVHTATSGVAHNA
ncbi:MAG: acetyl-CoA carboxylase carboxyltransferase subunit, partial [Actinobacteria bacterium]|nr:acetyl-CoA carboxylase carboxyltransferase subunit [Actinomycetota bacterium]